MFPVIVFPAFAEEASVYSAVPSGEYLQYGGQAVVEGVMMRSPRFFSVAVRAPNDQIVVQTEPIEKTWIGRQKWLKLPFLRGSLALLDAIALGARAMHFSANVQMEERYQPGADASHTEHLKEGTSAEGSVLINPRKTGGDSIQTAAITVTLIIGLSIGLLLFVFLPNVLGEQLRRAGVESDTVLSLVSGLLKVVIFLGYIYLISRAESIRRVFQFHGAEHKAINTLEAEQELAMDNCRMQTRLHPRCGTSFAIVVLIIDIVLMLFVPRMLFPELGTFVNLLIRFGINLLMLIPIAGVSYELIRFAGRQRNKSYVKALFAPGLATQLLTTVEPDDKQIEVALVALRAVVDAEKTAAASAA